MDREGAAMKKSCGEYPYFDHLMAEHRRLDELIHQTLKAPPDWEEGDVDWPPRLVEHLTAIRQEMAHHFREEEEGGCLEEAVAHCPSLSTEVLHIEAEHNRLLADMDDLILRAKRLERPKPRDARALGQELQAVVHALRAHEAEETRVIERGFTRNVKGA
jgi:Hemerythrin HHE cation binding domain